MIKMNNEEEIKKFLINLLKAQTQFVYKNIFEKIPADQLSEEDYTKSVNMFFNSLSSNGIIKFGKVKMPDVGWNTGGWITLYTQMFLIHQFMNDNYSKENIKIIEETGIEGPPFYENIIINPGEVAIDAGAYIGEWSALVSVMGGIAYAFEPSPRYHELLDATAKMNGFIVVPFGLGNKDSIEKFNTERIVMTDGFDENGNVEVQMIKIDTFRKMIGRKIDFIKADIEGFEANMLEGARKTLIEDCPKLAISTEHNQNDPEILESLIKSINPNYIVIQGQKVLYAYVPEKV